MIKFFRNIRREFMEQNPPDGRAGKTSRPSLPVGRYFKYAIGEIILVVIGILIALQINNWNENRKNRITETEYLNRLEEETNWNIKQLEYNASQYLETSNQLNTIIEYVEKGVQDSTKFDISRVNYIHPWIIKSSTYNELISTGDLKFIRDVHLRDLLDEVNSFANFADQQLQNWRNTAIEHESFFIPYKSSVLKKDNDDNSYYKSALDFNKMKGDETVIELLKHWSVGNMVFYDGTNMLKTNFIKVLERIECIRENTDCPIKSSEIIKN